MMIAIVDAYQYILQPLSPFSFFGLTVTTLDVVAALRLCIAMRQLREEQYRRYLARPDSSRKSVDGSSFVRSLMATLLVVYGGEAITAPFLGYPPSFMVSPTFPLLYALAQAFADFIPAVPLQTATNELPLALFDGLSRAYLLCNLIPPPVTGNTSPLLAQSPWALLLTSLITANGGFFLTNLFSFLEPTPLAVQTPPEMQPYGWTTIDVWCAPLITGLYAFLTHAQPFWADIHNVLSELLGMQAAGKQVLPLDPEVARANCALILALLFSGRTLNRFGFLKFISSPKLKTQ